MVYITNSADENQVMLQHPPLLRVLHSGSVESHNTEFIKTSCRFDLSLFPFDTQHCDVMMVVMGGDVVIRPHVHFMLEHEPLYNFLSMPGEWSIEHKTVESKDTPGPVRFLALTLTLKRASLYYNLFLIAPLVVTSLVTPLVFWMPPGCGEKMSYLVALFLSNTVFFNFVGSILPRNVSEVPRLACFLSGTSVSCVVAMAATTLVLHRYQEEVDQLNVSSETGSNSLENKTVRPADGTTSTIKVLPVYKQEIDQLNVSFKGSNSVETVSLGSADCFVSTCSAEKRKQMKKEQDGLKCGEKEPKILEEAELETEDERRFRRRKNNTIVPEGKCLSRSKMVHYYACNDSWRLSAWALDKISFAIFCLINLSFYLWVFLNT
ncbi:neuronal acetylcholine receptor subunit alpha-7 [Aplysia californica]|uniref:Neuronal acetylcholine receptor subunit alpha-7 n=1 Tax=Aplysia californica TaxID=6500 RepID=A0ABM0JQZ9_APLCA|nr:neuronal acetylcholine receptor subunit alpha-7 [Aplysia californica]